MSAATTPSSRTTSSRAIANGYAAFCLTVDTAHYSRRERDIAKRYVTRRPRAAPPAATFQKALDWRTVKLIKDKFKIPLVIKGIATARGCRRSRSITASTGSTSPTTAAASSITAAAPCRCCRRSSRRSPAAPRSWSTAGSAAAPTSSRRIASGADLVGIGRLQCFALAAAGEAGIVRMLELLEDEVLRCLGLLGVKNFAELDKSYLHPATPTNLPHVFSAFPLLDIEPYRY